MREGLRGASIFDDGGEATRVEARAADERTVNVGLGKELLGVLGLDAAAVLDADTFGRGGREELAQVLADELMRFLGLGGRGSLAGANGPNGLVGEDDVGDFLFCEPGEALGKLGLEDFFPRVALALREGFADADDGLDLGGQRRLGLAVDGGVVFLENTGGARNGR